MTWEIITGKLEDVLPTLGDVDHAIFDGPYSERVHRSVRTAARRDMPDVQASKCRTRRTVDLGFEHLTPELRREVASWCGSHVLGWTLAFADVEGVAWWQADLEAAGMRYRRTVPWVRRGGAPQFSGTHPASAFECIVCAHVPGRFRWNGGGHARIYDYPIVCNRKGQQGSRLHPAQKPLEMMREIVRDFTDPGDLIVDPFAGVGTTVLAAALEGRRAVGIERSPAWADIARERITSELAGVPYRRVMGSIAEMAGKQRAVEVTG